MSIINRNGLNPAILGACLLVFACFACDTKPAPEVTKPYTVVIERKETNRQTGTRGRQITEMSIEAINDSAAYLKGMDILFAQLHAAVFSEQDTSIEFEYDPHRLIVRDETQRDIVQNLPESVIEYGLDYFERKKQ